MTVRGKGLLVNVALALSSLVLSLGVMEGSLRILTRWVLIYDIEMWKYAKELKRVSEDPLIGHEHVPNIRARLYGVDVVINSHGLRDHEYTDAKPRGVFRILVLGDSVTMGWGVPLEDTYPKQLERLLNQQATGGEPRYEVINSGVGNYNTVMEIEYLEKRGVKYSPDMVILGWFVNDAEPIPRRVRNPLLEHSRLMVLGWMGTQYLLTLLGLEPDYRQYYLDLYRDDLPGWVAARNAIRQFGRLSRLKGFRPVALLLPEFHTLGKGYPFRDVHRKVSEVARSEEIPVLDGLQIFDGLDGRQLWVSRADSHMNANAHRITARALLEFLQKRSLLRVRSQK